MRLQVSPHRYAIIATAATVSLAIIVLTGAGVRLTGSGLGCTTWPTCDGSVIAPNYIHSWIEYGNRLISGLVGLLAIAAGVLAFFRTPFRKDLAVLGVLLPLGVVAQALLGMWTVKFHLQPGFVMGHFLLSMVILIAAVTLVWRAWHEPGSRARNPDMLAVWGTRALLPLSCLLFFMGTVATAAGPHPGSSRTGQVVHRLNWQGSDTMDWAIHWHGRLGTLLGVCCVVLWFLLRRRGADRVLLTSIAATAVLIGVQGVVGAIQYFNGLPTEVVWVHIAVATMAWTTMMWAVCSAGRPVPRDERARESRREPAVSSA